MNALSIAVPLLLLAATLPVAGCGGKAAESASASDSAAVRFSASDVAAVTRMDLVSGVPVSGTLMPGLDVRLTSPLDDVLAEVRVREGERVAKDQVLARFRQEEVEAVAASAKAALEAARADAERNRNLFAEGAVARRDVETAEAQWRAAEAQYAAMRKRFEDATVRAPFAGTVAERQVEAGDRVGTGDPLFRVVDTRELEFEATVPAEFVRDVKPGSAVSLGVAGGAPGAIEGRVARVNAAADPATRQVQVYVRVRNGDGRLVSGLFATGDVVTRRAAGVLAVPTVAVREEPSGTFVWVVDKGKLARRAVRVGLRDRAADRVEIVAGVALGELAVTGPIAGLGEGQSVAVDTGGR